MKIRQTTRHFAARKPLELPGVRDVAATGLVRLHTRIFLAKADPEHREDRRDQLTDLFASTIDAYLAALRTGFTEAEAREITHMQANIDFAIHRWSEMMEIPIDELDEHVVRYQQFFDAHGISLSDSLGAFRPPNGIAKAPATPGRLEDPAYQFAQAGYADDVYVESDESGIALEEAVITEAPGVADPMVDRDDT